MAAKPGVPKPGAAPAAEGNFVFRVQKFPNGAIYEGEWRNGKKDGRGTYTFGDGSKFEGEFAGGMKQGRYVRLRRLFFLFLSVRPLLILRYFQRPLLGLERRVLPRHVLPG